MQHPLAYPNIDQLVSLLQNFFLHAGVPPRRLPEQDWQNFMATPLPGLGTVSINNSPRGIDHFFSQPPPSPPYYSPTVVPSVGGSEASRIVELLEYMRGNRLQPNLGMSFPPATATSSGFVPHSFPNFPNIPGFDSGELQAAVQSYPGPRFPDLSFPGYPPELHPLAAAVLSSNDRPLFGISPSTNPSLLDSLELHLPVAASPSDLPESSLSSAAASPSCSHLLSTMSPLTNPSPPDIPASDKIIGLDLPAASPTSDDGCFPFNASSSSPFDFQTASPTNNGSHSPVETSSSSPLDPQFDEIPCAQSNSHGPGDNPDLTSGYETSDPGSTVVKSSVQECPQGSDANDQQRVLKLMENCGRGVHKCLWTRGGDKACGFSGTAAPVRRHITRVHLRLRCVLE